MMQFTSGSGFLLTFIRHIPYDAIKVRFYMKIFNKKGFTLLEMLTVLAIMGILSAIAYPNLKTYMAGRRLNGAVRQVFGDLMAARQRAITENRSIGVEFTSDHVYIIFADTNNSGTRDGAEALLQTRDIHPNFYDVWIDGQGRLVDFYPNGAGRNPVINFGLSGEAASKNITVSTAGRIKIN